MWFECIRYRFRLNADQDCLELAQVAALKSLRSSPRCQSWRVVPAPGDPAALILAIEWDPGQSQTPFRSSQEFADLHAALGTQVRALEEADYRADTQLLRRILGGPDALFRLAEDIVAGILADPELRWRFHSEDGSRRARLGLWLLEILGGPDLFSSSFPDAIISEGPLSGEPESEEPLDLDERDRLLEIASSALPSSAEEQGRCVLGALRAHLPLHPPPPSRLASVARSLEAAALRGTLRIPAAATRGASKDEPGLHHLALCALPRLADPDAATRGAPPSSRPVAAASSRYEVATAVPPSCQRQNTESEDPELEVSELLPTGTEKGLG